MSETADRLVHMANQIARNFAAQGEETAIAATTEHIRLFWDPRMVATILEVEHDALNPIAGGAVKMLATERQ